MSFLAVAPEALTGAAGDLAGIGSTIHEANVAAAAQTTNVVAAAADEVSAQIAAVFRVHAWNYQPSARK
jgi:hypothetical protein